MDVNFAGKVRKAGESSFVVTVPREVMVLAELSEGETYQFSVTKKGDLNVRQAYS